MPNYVLPTVFFVVTALLALLAIEPTTLVPRLTAYGTMAATVAAYLVWPVVGSLALLGGYLGARWARIAGRRARAALDAYVDARIVAHRRELSNIDQTTIAEMIVRAPNQLDTLAGHLGIGKASTDSDSISARVAKLEQLATVRVEHAEQVATLEERLRKVQQYVETSHEWTRDQFTRRDIARALRDGWPTVHRTADRLVKIPERGDNTTTWHSWFNDRDSWKLDYKVWTSHFPNIKRFDAVRDVLNVTAEEIALSHSMNAVSFKFGTHPQENAYFTFLAQYHRFRNEAPAALEQMEIMASVDSNRAIT